MDKGSKLLEREAQGKELVRNLSAMYRRRSVCDFLNPYSMHAVREEVGGSRTGHPGGCARNAPTLCCLSLFWLLL
jgi:hypothetical protein